MIGKFVMPTEFTVEHCTKNDDRSQISDICLPVTVVSISTSYRRNQSITTLSSQWLQTLYKKGTKG